MALAKRAAQAYGRNEQLAETVLLAETHTDAEIGSFREDLAERRRAIDPPPPDQ
jgi:hypothetical protein